jgi:glucan 1,3-beta-glucosidase
VGINITSVFVATFQDLTFANCNYGISTGTSAGAISLIDSSASACVAGVNAYVSGNGQGSLTLDNFQTDSGTVAVRSSEGDTLLQGSVAGGLTWVLGNASPQGYQGGTQYQIYKPAALLSNDKYFTLAAPQYEQYDISQVVSLKNDSRYPVYGDSELFFI